MDIKLFIHSCLEFEVGELLNLFEIHAFIPFGSVLAIISATTLSKSFSFLLLILLLCVCWYTWWCSTSPLGSVHLFSFFSLSAPLNGQFQLPYLQVHCLFCQLETTISPSSQFFISINELFSSTFLFYFFL